MLALSKRFAAGFGTALAVAFFLNVLPFLCQSFTFEHDSDTTFGFPFVFQRGGGKAGIYEFHYVAALVDVALALIVAFEVGYACARKRKNLT